MTYGKNVKDLMEKDKKYKEEEAPRVAANSPISTEAPLNEAQDYIQNTLKKPLPENDYNRLGHNGSFKFKVSGCKHAKLDVGK